MAQLHSIPAMHYRCKMHFQICQTFSGPLADLCTLSGSELQNIGQATGLGCIKGNSSGVCYGCCKLNVSEHE